MLLRLAKALVLLAGLAFLAGLGAMAWWKSRPAPPAPPAPAPAPAPAPSAGSQGRLAIVLDDWGYQSKPLASLERLGYVVTVAVLPGLPHSLSAAETAQRLGDEVIVHLPMQPEAGLKLVPGTLMAGTPAGELDRQLEAHWAAVPHAVGLNNHEGSKATQDPVVMRQVAEFLGRKGAYFLDSLTTPRSRGREAAKAAGIPFAARRVFLDNVDSPEAVRAALDEAAGIALKSGSCVAIGHPRPATLAVLEAAGPGLKAQGLELVKVSALAGRLE